ncbi:hypothetical protein CHS0354_015583 [Potamilus streckersoni]|uniref:Uncharacterized protein n=1 Tax=Potamilus streckersoni TaxID=2493646 RepID=A0AAE0RLI6_9BIVA|nr:hypothetical protein CHS0354_015583 [Potamilus streckersoni]
MSYNIDRKSEPSFSIHLDSAQAGNWRDMSRSFKWVSLYMGVDRRDMAVTFQWESLHMGCGQEGYGSNISVCVFSRGVDKRDLASPDDSCLQVFKLLGRRHF